MTINEQRDAVTGWGKDGFAGTAKEIPREGWEKPRQIRVKNHRILMTRSKKPHEDMFFVVIQRGEKMRRKNIVLFLPADAAAALMTAIGTFVRPSDLHDSSMYAENKKP